MDINECNSVRSVYRKEEEVFPKCDQVISEIHRGWNRIFDIQEANIWSPSKLNGILKFIVVICTVHQAFHLKHNLVINRSNFITRPRIHEIFI